MKGNKVGERHMQNYKLAFSSISHLFLLGDSFKKEAHIPYTFQYYPYF
jgi:hypothetical protein